MSEGVGVTMAEVGALGARMRGALGGVLESLPEGERTAERVAKRYPIDGAAARRLIRAVRAPSDAEVLTRLPATKALHKLAQASESGELAGLIEEFGAMTKRAGTSKAALTGLIRSARDEGALG